MASGVHRKTQHLSNFVSDPLMLHFMTTEPVGHDRLAEYLKSLGMVLAEDGGITIDQALSKRNDKWVTMLSNLDKSCYYKIVCHCIELFYTNNSMSTHILLHFNIDN